MGSCISKSKSSTDEEDDPEPAVQFQDKRVIDIASSQNIAPLLPPIHPKCKLPSSPPPPVKVVLPKRDISSPSPPFSGTPSASSLSSFSSTSSCTSCASSKDRSFSNEFLWSCAKENPHILQDDEFKKQSTPRKTGETKSSPPTGAAPRPQRGPPLRPTSCSPKKSVRRRAAPPSPARIRSTSPPLGRQRSFRRDDPVERPGSSPLPRQRNVGSSPSRRFGKENCGQSHLKTKKKINIGKVAAATDYCQTRNKKIKETGQPPASPSRLMKKETSGCNRAQVDQADLIKKQTCSTLLHHTIDREDGREGTTCEQEMESTHPLEDIDNPHIALDCFIFL